MCGTSISINRTDKSWSGLWEMVQRLTLQPKGMMPRPKPSIFRYSMARTIRWPSLSSSLSIALGNWTGASLSKPSSSSRSRTRSRPLASLMRFCCAVSRARAEWPISVIECTCTKISRAGRLISLGRSPMARSELMDSGRGACWEEVELERSESRSWVSTFLISCEWVKSKWVCFVRRVGKEMMDGWATELGGLEGRTR